MAAGFKQNFWIGKRTNNQINQETRKIRSGKIVSSRALGHPSAISSADKYLRYYCFILILLFLMFLDPLMLHCSCLLLIPLWSWTSHGRSMWFGWFFYVNTSFVTFSVHRFKFKIRVATMTSSISQQTKKLKQTKPPKKQKAKKDPAKQNKNKSKLYSFHMLLQPLIKNQAA